MERHEKKSRIGENTEDVLVKIKNTMDQMIDFTSGIIDHDILDKLITRIMSMIFIWIWVWNWILTVVQ